MANNRTGRTTVGKNSVVCEPCSRCYERVKIEAPENVILGWMCSHKGGWSVGRVYSFKMAP